ncbi:MAG: GatB/YqeY domain-containing protein [Candidatus Promineifilaceae bacterium]
MGVRDQLDADLKQAMRGGDAETRDTLRMLLAAIKQVEIDEMVQLDDQGVLAVLSKQAKQRRESIKDAKAAGRPDIIAEEQRELDIINDYLPQMMTADEIEPIARSIIEEIGATGMQDMGRVMAKLMPEVKGKADGALVSSVVRSLLQS